MKLQKINVKFFVSEPDTVPLTAFIDVFHGWIQATDGVYWDVADYSHMHGGPGIVLVSNEANISIDEGAGRRGLLFSSKRDLTGSNRERLREVFYETLNYCLKVEQEPALERKVKFRGDEALVTINDRLLAPNSPETFRAVSDDFEDFALTLFRGTELELQPDGDDARKRFGITIKARKAFDATTLLKNLAETGAEVSRGPAL
jgi:hypothetical protein